MTVQALAASLSAGPKRHRVPSVSRIEAGGAVRDRLYFAQVREDPLLDIEALSPLGGGTFVVVGSGGCTALSLLAAGASHVLAVDCNRVQNNVTELKAAALAVVEIENLTGFLGGAQMPADRRAGIYRALRASLSHEARSYWDTNEAMIERGVINAGVSERFIAGLASIVRRAIHPATRIERLLGCDTLEAQRKLYAEEWNSRRWRALFALLLNRVVFNRTYDPAFFSGVDNPGFARHFYRLFERSLCEVPVRTNYFLHHMLTGSYPVGTGGGVPLYLEKGGGEALRNDVGDLQLVDGRYEEFLARCPENSINGFALSNICEWMPADAADVLFREVVRTAKPGARVCFRNFVGRTDVPPRLRKVVREDVARGAAAIVRDRSCVQARIAYCTVEK